MLTDKQLRKIMTDTITELSKIVDNKKEPAYARTKAASALNNAIKTYRDLFPEEPKENTKMRSIKNF